MWAENFHVYKLDLEKAMENGTRDQIADNCWIIEKEKKIVTIILYQAHLLVFICEANTAIFKNSKTQDLYFTKIPSFVLFI